MARSTTTVRASVDAELRRLKATTTVEGRTAQRLADLIDSMRSARDAAGTVRELRDVMSAIRDKAKETQQSPLKGLREQRRTRRVVSLEEHRDRAAGS